MFVGSSKIIITALPATAVVATGLSSIKDTRDTFIPFSTLATGLSLTSSISKRVAAIFSPDWGVCLVALISMGLLGRDCDKVGVLEFIMEPLSLLEASKVKSLERTAFWRTEHVVHFLDGTARAGASHFHLFHVSSKDRGGLGEVIVIGATGGVVHSKVRAPTGSGDRVHIGRLSEGESDGAWFRTIHSEVMVTAITLNLGKATFSNVDTIL